MTSDLLRAVVAAATRAAGERERSGDRAALDRDLAAARPDGAGFEAALRAPGVRVIAECKRRSPSKGVLRREYDPVAIATGYAAAGAAAISVLTEPTFFDGSLDHLRHVRRAVTVPVLRKDFVVTDFQVTEARAAGADAVLLIVAALDQPALRRLLARAHDLGLAALVEVHDATELTRALEAGARVVGVNSRNLRSLEVNTALFDELAPAFPEDVVAVAESGLRDAAHLGRLAALRYDAFLIGERLVTEPDPGAALAALLTAAGGGEAR
ncbi:MAG: indole-3-glycerol phosphate synthase TrpC [Vicinamibacterales bacterium]